MKSPTEMDYKELDLLLEMLLRDEKLPSKIEYSDSQIYYCRKKRLRILLKALYTLGKAQIFYMNYMKKQLNNIKKNEQIYNALKETGCLRTQRIYLYLSKIGLGDFASHIGGRFNDEIFANFTVATMLYDCAFDIPICSKYLGDFDRFIMKDEKIKSDDPCLLTFQQSVNYIENKLGKSAFKNFMKLVRIEHVAQLMSSYQLSDEKISKDNLLKITFAKGGISALALMYLMAPNMKSKEKIAVYELGSVLQLIDDITDMSEDLKTGIRTLPNQKMLSFEELKQLYFGTVNNLMEKCNLKKDQPNGTLDMLCWFADIILEKRYKKFLQIQ